MYLFLLQVVSLLMVTEVYVEYEVHFAVVVLDNPYRSCRLQLLVLLVIVPDDYCNFLLVLIGFVACGHLWIL